MTTLSNDVVGETVVTLCLLRVPFTSHGSAAAVCSKWRDIVKSTQFLAARRSGGFSEHALFVGGGRDGQDHIYQTEAWLRVGDTWHPCRVPARAPRTGVEVNDITAVDIGSGKAAFVGYEDCVKIFDVKQNSWTDLPRMRTARFEPAVAFVKNMLVVVGGRESARIGSRIHSTGETYDFVSQTWSAMPDIPIPVYSASVGVIGDKVYVAGGSNSSDDLYALGSPGDPGISSYGILDALQVYCSTSRTWTLKKRLHLPRYGTATAVRDGKLYVIGGEVFREDQDDIYEDDQCMQYCPVDDVVVMGRGFGAEADTWYYSPHLPTERVCPAACNWNGSIVLFGSGSTSRPMPPLIYGLDADHWDWDKPFEFSDYFTDTDSDPEERRRRSRRILDADSSDEEDSGDERWWNRRLRDETDEHADARRTRRAWRVFRGCPAALHEVCVPAVVSLELG